MTSSYKVAAPAYKWFNPWRIYVAGDSLRCLIPPPSGQGLPGVAMLRVLEYWLDNATKRSVTNIIKENPALRYADFFWNCVVEFQVEPNVTKHHKWRPPHHDGLRALVSGSVVFFMDLEWRSNGIVGNVVGLVTGPPAPLPGSCSYSLRVLIFLGRNMVFSCFPLATHG